MRGLDKALEEVLSARNRVVRLYGLNRLSREEMRYVEKALTEAEWRINNIIQGESLDGRQEEEVERTISC